MRIRKIRVTDIENLVSLDRSCFSRDIAYSKHTFHSILSYPNSSGLLVEKGSIVIAFILVHWTDRTAEMITIDVSSEFRRKGIGTRLLHLTEGELQKRGIVSEYLHVSTDNDPALSFYRKEGFRLQRRVARF